MSWSSTGCARSAPARLDRQLGEIIERGLGNFRPADKDLADRLLKAIRELRKG